MVEEACKGGEWWGPPFLNLKIVMWVNVEGLSMCVFVDGWL